MRREVPGPLRQRRAASPRCAAPAPPRTAGRIPHQLTFTNLLRLFSASTGEPELAEEDFRANTRWAEWRDKAMREAAAAVDLFVAPSLYLRDRFIGDWARGPPLSLFCMSPRRPRAA